MESKKHKPKTKYFAFNIRKDDIHLKYYVESKYGIDKGGNVKLAKCSSFCIHVFGLLRTISFPMPKQINKELPIVKLKYFEESFSKFLPNDADSSIVEFLDRQFREELIAFVSGCHQKDGEEYTIYVWQFLERYNIVRDEHILGETARKIYRDYLEKNLKNHQKFFSNLSAKSPICPSIQ